MERVRGWYTKQEICEFFRFSVAYFERDVAPRLASESVRDHGPGRPKHYEGRAVHDALVERAVEVTKKQNLASDTDEELKLARLRRLNFELEERQKLVIPRIMVHEDITRLAAIWRETAEQLSRQYGDDAIDLMNAGLDKFRRESRVIYPDGLAVTVRPEADAAPARKKPVAKKAVKGAARGGSGGSRGRKKAVSGSRKKPVARGKKT